MINRIFLNLVLLPSSIYQKMGINTLQLKAILDAKLKMDDRRPSGVQLGKKRNQKKEVSTATLGTMLMMALLGLLFITSFFSSNNPVTQFTIFYSFFIFVLASTLISDFTSVLIDVRDNFIILPKPVSDRTFLLSRLLHILIHISKLVLPLNLPTMVVLFLQKGMLSVLFFLLLLPFVTIFTIFLINAIYLVILKITTADKFKAIISYFQIVFAILIYGGYQIIPRIMDLSVLENYEIPQNGWTLLAPPYWFAALWKAVYFREANSYLFFASTLAILIPVFSLWLIIKYFAPSFNQKLGMIAGGENAALQVNNNKTISTKRNTVALSESLANKITKSGAERMGFRFAWLMTSRSRDFKLKTYPSIGYLLVMVVMTIIRRNKFSLIELKQGGKFSYIILLTSVYVVGMLVNQAMINIKISDRYKASWIYHITPLEKPGPLILGSIKALILKFYLPFAILIITGCISLIGWEPVPNLLLGFSNQLCIFFTIAYLSFNQLPFSHSDMGRMRGGNFARSFITMLLPWVIGIGHYFIYDFQPVVYILLVLSVVTAWLLADSVRNRGWEMMKIQES